MADSPRSFGWRGWTAAIGAAVLLRALVAMVWLRGMPMAGDARDYFDVALRFASGDVGGAFYWPPGESALLAAAFAAFGASVAVARVVTIATSAATVVLGAKIARELAGERAERAGAWIGALYAPSVLLCGQTYSQHLAAACLAAIAYFGMRALRERRAWLFALAGIALGLGCLTRPSMASVAPVLAIAAALVARRDRPARARIALGVALATTLALAVVVPAQSHDAVAGAGWTLSTNNERNLFLGNNPYTPDAKTSHLAQRSLDEIDPAARAYLESFYARPDARSAMQRAALDYMRAHPLRTLWRSLQRAAAFWGFDYLASREISKWRGGGALPLLAIEAGSYVAVAVLALLALFARRGALDPAWRAWLVALALAYEAPYVVAFSGGTYHFPVMPLVIAIAAAGATSRAAWERARGRRALWVALGALAALQVEYAAVAVAMRG